MSKPVVMNYIYYRNLKKRWNAIDYNMNMAMVACALSVPIEVVGAGIECTISWLTGGPFAAPIAQTALEVTLGGFIGTSLTSLLASERVESFGRRINKEKVARKDFDDTAGYKMLMQAVEKGIASPSRRDPRSSSGIGSPRA